MLQRHFNEVFQKGGNTDFSTADCLTLFHSDPTEKKRIYISISLWKCSALRVSTTSVAPEKLGSQCCSGMCNHGVRDIIYYHEAGHSRQTTAQQQGHEIYEMSLKLHNKEGFFPLSEGVQL